MRAEGQAALKPQSQAGLESATRPSDHTGVSSSGAMIWRHQGCLVRISRGPPGPSDMVGTPSANLPNSSASVSGSSGPSNGTENVCFQRYGPVWTGAEPPSRIANSQTAQPNHVTARAVVTFRGTWSLGRAECGAGGILHKCSAGGALTTKRGGVGAMPCSSDQFNAESTILLGC
ncbi:hypothetical protein L209DRAFT_202549 [Thermothelomyces heterothallicus CBS 203.75]